MKVRFLVDYRGHLTAELFYTAGTVLEVVDEVGQQLIADGRAELVEEEQAEEEQPRKKR